jgi:hypothetical protein
VVEHPPSKWEALNSNPNITKKKKKKHKQTTDPPKNKNKKPPRSDWLRPLQFQKFQRSEEARLHSVHVLNPLF